MATGRSRTPLASPPVLSSGGGPWRGFVLEQHHPTDGFDLRDVFLPDHLLVTAVAGTSQLEWKEDGTYQGWELRPGEVLFIPASHPFSCRSRQPGDCLGVTLTPAFLRCAAHELLQLRGPLNLRPQKPVSDPFLAGALMSLRCEVEAHYPGGRAYGEAVANAVAAHVVRHFAISRGPEAPAVGARLSRAKLRRALDHIQEHLAEEIPLGALATAAGLSPFHFCRIFKHSTGLSPHRYIVQQRVERARELLLSAGSRISDVAQRVGFCDQSHLTSHFKRAYGITPREFRDRSISGETEG